MDKSWINKSRVSSEYEVGVKQFLDFAFDHVALSGRISCPCKNCNNVWNHPWEVVLEHLICYGFDQGYACITWGLHGETMPPSSPNELLDEDEHCDADDMHGMLNRALGIFNADGVPLEEPNAEAARFYKLMEDAEQELYQGCKKFSKLSFIVRLFHIKCLNGGTLDASVQTALTTMERHLTQMPEETDSITAKHIAFTKVMGEDNHGRARTYGLGVTSPSRRNDLSAEALADAERRVEEERARRLLADETLTTLQEELRLVRQELEQLKKEREEDRMVPIIWPA